MNFEDFQKSWQSQDPVKTISVNADVLLNEVRRNQQQFRTTIRDSLRVATTLGFGPRFLHSTGQLHKGGPNTGVFVQITSDDSEDVAIPGRPFTFSVLKHAQAAGDLHSLRAHGRRVIRVHVAGDLSAALRRLTEMVLPAPARP